MATKWTGTPPKRCDVCGKPLHECFVDGATKRGPWGIMCPGCFITNGIGLGTGMGQAYTIGGDRLHSSFQLYLAAGREEGRADCLAAVLALIEEKLDVLGDDRKFRLAWTELRNLRKHCIQQIAQLTEEEYDAARAQLPSDHPAATDPGIYGDSKREQAEGKRYEESERTRNVRGREFFKAIKGGKRDGEAS